MKQITVKMAGYSGQIECPETIAEMQERFGMTEDQVCEVAFRSLTYRPNYKDCADFEACKKVFEAYKPGQRKQGLKSVAKAAGIESAEDLAAKLAELKELRKQLGLE